MDDKEAPRHPLSKKGETEYLMGGVEQPANEAFGDFGGPGALNLKLVALFDALTFGQRENVLCRLGFKPVLKFFDETSGHWIKGHLCYGFYDAGGIALGGAGCPTKEACIQAIKTTGDYTDTSSFSTRPEDLGKFAICVLSGEEFVARLQQVDRFSAYGRFD
jgi:hypothetical protein